MWILMASSHHETDGPAAGAHGQLRHGYGALFRQGRCNGLDDQAERHPEIEIRPVGQGLGRYGVDFKGPPCLPAQSFHFALDDPQALWWFGRWHVEHLYPAQ